MSGIDEILSNGKLVAELQEFPRLPKPHLAWPFSASGNSRPARFPMWESRPLLNEFVRIAGSVPLSLRWATDAQLKLAAELSEEFDAPICVSCVPYERLAAQQSKPSDWGEAFQLDLRDLWDQLRRLAPLAQHIGHFVIDIEHWRRTVDNQRSLDAKHAILWDLARAAFPAARIIWYHHGAITPTAIPAAWQEDEYLTPNTPGDTRSCALYYDEWYLNQEIYRRTAESAGKQGIRDVIPFLALGGSFPRAAAGWGSFDRNDALAAQAWLAGFEINHPWCRTQPVRFPLSQAPFVFFWPAPGDERFPCWFDHFLAYCRGAQNLASAETANSA